jgi:soluble lytic murein transglycosylase
MAFSVIYDWRLHGTAVPLTVRLSAIGQPYALPDKATPRRAIGCPAPTPAAASSAPPAAAATAAGN